MQLQSRHFWRSILWVHGIRYRIRAAAVLLLGTLLTLAAGEAQASVPLIFDTDMGNDIDDALALGMIHALQSRGQCRLLAVTLTKDNPYAGPFVDVVNSFYGRGDVPIGVVRDGKTPEDGSYCRALATARDGDQPRYPHKLHDGHEAPEAVALLRKVLAAQRDESVVIVQVGFSTNLARLLDSPPDAVSPLGGRALVKKKVRLLCPMAGRFAPNPGGQRLKEYNVETDVRSAQKVFAEWPTPIVVSGFEIGNAVLFPARSIEQDYGYVSHHPLAEAYRLYGKMPYDRPTWDLTAVLQAVRPTAGYFDLSPPGRVIVENDGFARFQPQAGGPHRYLLLDPHQGPRIKEHFVALCRLPPDRMLSEPPAWKPSRPRPRSTRVVPEKRIELGNRTLRLDFDPRTSDTSYNYIWVRRPDTGQWERVHNFGIDVHAYQAGTDQEINCVGINLSLKRQGDTMRVAYPRPLFQYRQVDETVGTAQRIRQYPDFTAAELPGLVHADAALEFQYRLDADRPSFTIHGRVVEGRVKMAIAIIDALWVDNRACRRTNTSREWGNTIPPDPSRSAAETSSSSVSRATRSSTDRMGKGCRSPWCRCTKARAAFATSTTTGSVCATSGCPRSTSTSSRRTPP